MRRHYQMPPHYGPGSGKAEWKAFALELWEFAIDASNALEAGSNEISYLKGEIALLRKQIAERKPKGSRDTIPDETIARIEAAINRGESMRFIGQQFHVSAMTVSRIKKRMEARKAISVT